MTVSVSLSVREHISRTTVRLRQIFVHITYMSVARSSSGGVAICYVLPVSWMTSYLHIYRSASVTLEQPASQPASQPVGASGRLGLPRPLVVAETANW